LDLSIFEQPVVVFDTETTGTGRSDRLVEFGGLRFEPGQAPILFATLIRPGIPIPWHAQNVHNISEQMVAGQPSFDRVLPDIVAFFEGALVFAHNLSFDERLLRQSAEVSGGSIDFDGRCTVRLARRIHPERRGRGAHSLSGLADLYGLENPAAHRALGDAETTARLLACFVRRSPEVVATFVAGR
jgi:DNA polymerase-3 subunit epsilon